MKQITVELFGRLKDQLGFVEKACQTQAGTPAALWAELIARTDDQDGLAPDSIRPVINDAFAGWHQPLADGDRVAFLPPSSGG